MSDLISRRSFTTAATSIALATVVGRTLGQETAPQSQPPIPPGPSDPHSSAIIPLPNSDHPGRSRRSTGNWCRILSFTPTPTSI